MTLALGLFLSYTAAELVLGAIAFRAAMRRTRAALDRRRTRR